MARRRAWLAAAALVLSCAARGAGVADEPVARHGDDTNGVDLPLIVGEIPVTVPAETPPPGTTFAADPAARPAHGSADWSPHVAVASATSSVPESSETAMMAAGALWLVGVAARRRASDRRRS